MAHAEESNRLCPYFTVYCPECRKLLKVSTTLRNARYRLAQHLHTARGHPEKYQDWKFTMQAAASETYYEYKYNEVAGTWSDPMECGYVSEEDGQPAEGGAGHDEPEERPRPPPAAPPAKRPTTPTRRGGQSSSSGHLLQPEPLPEQDQQPAPQMPPQVAPPQVGLQLSAPMVVVAPGAFGPRAGYLPTGNPDVDFQRRVRILLDATNSVASAATRSAQVAEAACMGWRAEAESMRMVAAELRHLAERHL